MILIFFYMCIAIFKLDSKSFSFSFLLCLFYRELYRSVNSSINDLLSILPSHHKKPVKYQSKVRIFVCF